MIRDLHTRKKVYRNDHAAGAAQFRRSVGDAAYEAIVAWFLAQFDEQEWVNTGRHAPENWGGTPLEPVWLHYKGVADPRQRHDMSAALYGAIGYTALFDRPDMYEFHRPEGRHKDDPRPIGLTYRRAD